MRRASRSEDTNLPIQLGDLIGLLIQIVFVHADGVFTLLPVRSGKSRTNEGHVVGAYNSERSLSISALK